MCFRGYTPKNDYQPKVCLAVFYLTLQSLTLMEILGIFSSCPKLAQFELEMLHWMQSNYLKKFKLHKSI